MAGIVLLGKEITFVTKNFTFHMDAVEMEEKCLVFLWQENSHLCFLKHSFQFIVLHCQLIYFAFPLTRIIICMLDLLL